MNPNLCRVALRPRDPLEVLDLTFRLIRERWRPLLRLCAIVVLPLWLVTFPLCWVFEGHYALLAIPLALSAALQAPFTLLCGRLLFADEVALKDVFRDVLGSLPPLLAVWGIGLLGWGLSALTCGVAATFVQPALTWSTESALLERVGPQRAFRRTVRLAGGNPGDAIAAALGWWLLMLWGAMVGEGAGQSIVDFVLQLGTPFGSAWTGQVTPFLLGGLLVAQPLHAIYRLMLYVDVRTRTEGWDLQVALRAAGLAA